MSRTYKRFIPHYRSTKGYKRAILARQLHNIRAKSIPPNSWDDTKCDKQCYIYYKLINRLFLQGYETEEIYKKLKLRGMKTWQWKHYCKYSLNNTIDIKFENIVCINEDETETIPISTPGSEPLFSTRVWGIPLEHSNYILIGKKLLYVYTYNIYGGPFGSDYISTNIVTPLPHKTLTEIMLYVVEMFKSDGMKHDYIVERWDRGLGLCKIVTIDRKDSFL